MNCNDCIRVNPLPSCIDTDEVMLLTGLTFPDNAGEDILLKLTNTATRRVQYITITEGDPIDITDFFPLMNHYYKIEFSVNGVPVRATLTNPAATTSSGCCIEFFADETTWTGGEFILSDTNCPAL